MRNPFCAHRSATAGVLGLFDFSVVAMGAHIVTGMQMQIYVTTISSRTERNKIREHLGHDVKDTIVLDAKDSDTLRDVKDNIHARWG
jgi:thymidine kinase